MRKLLPLLLTSLLFAGCGEKAESDIIIKDVGPTQNVEIIKLVDFADQDVDITFWHAMAGSLEDELAKITDAFMALHPNIHIKLQNQGNYGDLQQKLTLTMVSPDQLPTLTQAYPNWMENALYDGLVVDLSAYVNNPEIGIEGYNEDIVEGFREASVINGIIYSVPFSKSTEVLWYNKTLLDELGLTPPTTFEQLAKTAKTITDETGIVGCGFDSLSNFYTTYLYSEGKNLNPELDVTGPESVAAINYYLKGVKDGYFRIAGTDIYHSGPFGNGLVAMYIGSNAGESFVKQGVGDKFEIGVAPYPSVASMQQGTDIFMFTNSTPEQRTAAYEYLKFLTNTENQIDWGITTGYIPARHSALTTDAYINSGSLVAPIAEEATENLYIISPNLETDQAYRESAVVLETILAEPDEADVNKSLENYEGTLLGIWE
ncbi:sugar ABC transporter substrate-binding protein [Candidatus Epulonipiscium fishelsonii]|uniref:Sugar ABC transporter substrate-binding protein n=1 Tax=Candidatus Epulonipiscium fishelsonii TaxID=77094 RepID=A0ACC8XBR1_9FIRM|nr:sugar ABC transporter substrate-binding protein [Epulopiscium sp. SCG-B05WGA-EpuloA1]ONI40036.1 sugar ABC transporter substrate-binding protein [Epulopiscium sp. SCG-B11WGA-EpuloA1]